MNEPIIFVTSNELKFKQAAGVLATQGITLIRQHMDLLEIQSHDGEAIVRHKAQQAFDALQKPVLVNDDTWYIPGLRGFPGPYMKDVNTWFTDQNWLELTRSLTDRQIVLRQNIAYQDVEGQHYFVKDIPGLLLPEVRGDNKYPHLTITSFDGGNHSAAEIIATGKQAIGPDIPGGWHIFADWLATR